MLRRTAGLVVAAFALVLATAGTASAHPLGNFTVNHYAGVELAGDRVYVRYVLDMAEIPTFQFGDDVRAAGAVYSDEATVTDGILLTGRGPDDLPAFAQALMALLGVSAARKSQIPTTKFQTKQ